MSEESRTSHGQGINRNRSPVKGVIFSAMALTLCLPTSSGMNRWCARFPSETSSESYILIVISSVDSISSPLCKAGTSAETRCDPIPPAPIIAISKSLTL